MSFWIFSNLVYGMAFNKFTTYPDLVVSSLNELMDSIAEGWSKQDSDLALSGFSEDALYLEPPGIHYYLILSRNS